MSDEVRAWARRQQIPKAAAGAAKPSTAKAVLNSIANCAGDFGLAFASNAHVLEETCLDRKSIIDGFKRLEELGLIVDTGERRGRTGQIRVWRLNLKIELVGEASRQRDAIKIRPAQSTEDDEDCEGNNLKRPADGTLVNKSEGSVDIRSKGPDDGTLKASQQRDASTDSYPQSVPFSPPDRDASLITDLKIGIQNKSSGSPPVDKAQAGPEWKADSDPWIALEREASSLGFRLPNRALETSRAYATQLRLFKDRQGCRLTDAGRRIAADVKASLARHRPT